MIPARAGSEICAISFSCPRFRAGAGSLVVRSDGMEVVGELVCTGVSSIQHRARAAQAASLPVELETVLRMSALRGRGSLTACCGRLCRCCQREMCALGWIVCLPKAVRGKSVALALRPSHMRSGRKLAAEVSIMGISFQDRPSTNHVRLKHKPKSRSNGWMRRFSSYPYRNDKSLWWWCNEFWTKAGRKPKKFKFRLRTSGRHNPPLQRLELCKTARDCSMDCSDLPHTNIQRSGCQWRESNTSGPASGRHISAVSTTGFHPPSATTQHHDMIKTPEKLEIVRSSARNHLIRISSHDVAGLWCNPAARESRASWLLRYIINFSAASNIHTPA